MDTQLEEMREQMNTLKNKLEQQEIINDRIIRQSLRRSASSIKQRYTLVCVLCLFMIPYGYWAFVKLNGSSIGVWIFMSILMLIAFGYTLYTGRYLRSDDLYTKSLIEARQRVAKAKKLDSDWLKIGIPAGFVWIVYFFYDIYSKTTDDSIWLFLAAMLIGCLIGCLIGLKIHYRNQNMYQDIIDQIENLTQE